MKKERRCRTCIYWGKPANKKALKDYSYPCTAPVQTYGLPASVIRTIDKRPMERDEGTECPTWVPAL